MKILTYIISLLLGGFVYFLFAAYMTVAAGLNSFGPLISVGIAILIFSFLSWFHFYYTKIGAILLTIGVIVMYITWPVNLMIEYFGESEYNPSPLEFLTPLVLGALVIFGAWRSKNIELHKWTKLTLAIPPTLIGLYVGGYMFMRLI